MRLNEQNLRNLPSVVSTYVTLGATLVQLGVPVKVIRTETIIMHALRNRTAYLLHNAFCTYEPGPEFLFLN